VKSESECKHLGEMLDRDNPRVMAYLESLSHENIDSAIKGIELCDGSNPLKDLVYQGRIVSLPEWHIFLFYFKKENRNVAFAWVEKGGKALWIPSNVNGPNYGEHAYVLSYDVYTYSRVQPGEDVVIINYPHGDWIAWLIRVREKPK